MIKVEFLDGTANKLMNNATDKLKKLTSSEYRMLSEINETLNTEVAGEYTLKSKGTKVPIEFELTKNNKVVDKGLEKLNKGKSRYTITIDKDDNDESIIVVNCNNKDYPFQFKKKPIPEIVMSVQKDLGMLGLIKGV